MGWLAAATVLILAWRWPAFGVVTPASVWVYAVFLDPGFLVVVAVGAAALARPRWAPGLAIVAYTWLPDRLDAVRVAGILGLPPLVVLATIAAVALAAVATLLTIKATRDLRRLPTDDTIWAPRDVT